MELKWNLKDHRVGKRIIQLDQNIHHCPKPNFLLFNLRKKLWKRKRKFKRICWAKGVNKSFVLICLKAREKAQSLFTYLKTEGSFCIFFMSKVSWQWVLKFLFSSLKKCSDLFKMYLWHSDDHWNGQRRGKNAESFQLITKIGHMNNFAVVRAFLLFFCAT